MPLLCTRLVDASSRCYDIAGRNKGGQCAHSSETKPAGAGDCRCCSVGGVAEQESEAKQEPHGDKEKRKREGDTKPEAAKEGSKAVGGGRQRSQVNSLLPETLSVTTHRRRRNTLGEVNGSQKLSGGAVAGEGGGGGSTGHRRKKSRTVFKASAQSVESAENPSSQQRVITCASCRSVPEGEAFVSYDPQLKAYYISGRQPESSIYSLVRRACVRSLSCEIGAGPECTGSVFFDMDSSMFVLSYVFKLLDGQARGFRRLYSFMIILPGRAHILASRTYFEGMFMHLSHCLGARATVKYLREKPTQPQMSAGMMR